MHVVAGGIKLNSPEGEEERVNVANIIGHPDYNSRDLTNDICLLKANCSIFIYSSNNIFPRPTLPPNKKEKEVWAGHMASSSPGSIRVVCGGRVCFRLQKCCLL